MSTDRKTIRLLILEDSQNETERLVSLFRNAGHATRVYRITSADDLLQILPQGWDLLLAAPESTAIAPAEVLNTIRRQAKDIPFIQLVAGNESDAITRALTLGAQDAVPQGDDERLILVANRELANLDERRARRAAEVALREVEKRCRLLESAADAVAYVHDGMHIYANQSYLDLFGYEDVEDLEGTPMVDLVAGSDQAVFKDFLRNYHNAETNAELSCQGVRLDGQAFAARMTFSAATYDGEPCVQVMIRCEVDNAQLERKLREVSQLDQVTGFFNRSHFLDLMDEAVKHAVTANQPASMAYMLLDRAPMLQLNLGVANIDQLLVDLSTLLRASLPENAQLARFNDSVFTALLPGQPPEKAEPLLASLLKKVETHLFDINGRTAQVTLSIGVVGLDEKTTRTEDVIERAHRCADEVEQKNGNGLKRYNPADELAAAANSGDTQAIIRQALEQNSFQLFFMPIMSLHGDKHEHYEVLLRLSNPQGKEIPPMEFLAAAKIGGLAEKIDRWVLFHAIKLLAERRAKGHNTKLFVHISSASVQDPELLQWLTVILKASRLPAGALIIQISERDAVNHLKQAKILSQGLIKLQCQVSLCQFGRALNPLNTLRHMSVDFVKVDGSYMQDLNTPENQEAMKALITELHAQSKLTIAPMVESAGILSALWQTGVNYIQGYYLQKPSRSMDYDFALEN